MTDEIVDYAHARGVRPVRPALRDVLTTEQLEQIKYARERGVPWAVIARYFKEEHDISYGESTFSRLLP